MSRKRFIESKGATCKNWQWSWSFVNHEEKFIIFGAWDRNKEGQKILIFSDDWKFNSSGKKQSGYQQSREHIRLVEKESYRLMTFPMKYSDERKDEAGFGPAKIGDFTPILSERKLTKIGHSWYASDGSNGITLAEEIIFPEKYVEGAKVSITINSYERNTTARKKCIQYHGSICMVCGFDFKKIYGSIGEGFIHVHHIVPIGQIGDSYEVDPVQDLIPVCPNCHAMIHHVDPPLTISEVRNLLEENKHQ
ncbi:MAG: HNH endonuclease [Desulfamplus sp.]|nr:HNH endonuclease [Desulfamplus sp.]